MALSGTVTSGSASGTVRMKVRFYEGDEESGACDSGDVTWRAASGPMPPVVGPLPEIRRVGRYLAPAPSLAGPVSPQRRRFAESVDNTCAREYNEIKARRAEASRLYGGRDGADRLVWATFVDGHEAEVRELRALGDPPEAQSVYRAWLENMAGRASLERRMVGETYSQALATYARIVRMKGEANLLARRFGLTVCSSNSLPWTPRGPASPPDDLVGGPPVRQGQRT